MWEQFWIQNTQYIIHVFVAFWMITASWIYFDGWLIDRQKKTLFRSIGFLILSIWAFLVAIPIENVTIGQIENLTGLAGFAIVLFSLLIDPVPTKPEEKKSTPSLIARIKSLFTRPSSNIIFAGPAAAVLDKTSDFFINIRGFFGRLLAFFIPILAAIGAFITKPVFWMFIFAMIITILVRRHYTKGIQSEWKYFYLGFLWITIALAISFVSSLLHSSSNVLIAQIFSPFHIAWILEHAIKLIGAVLLGMWAWGFIRFRLFPQILSSAAALTFIIFITTTIIYTGFLLNRMQGDAITGMVTNIKTVDFALNQVKDSAILAARIASISPQVREAVRRDDKDALFTNLNTIMFENGTDFMLAVNTGGEVLMRAEDKERFGDSIAEDPVVWRALDGKAVVTAVAEQGVTIPRVSIRSASPIIDTSEAGDLEIIGAIVTGFLLDTAFVDGLKRITGLEVTVFANDVRSATTFVIPESQTRLLGTREYNQEILNTVLKKGESYTGTTKVLNQPFLAAYLPLRDIEETEIGMLFTGRSHASVLTVASETMQLTFLTSILMMLFAMFPLWLMARFITRNLQA